MITDTKINEPGKTRELVPVTLINRKKDGNELGSKNKKFMFIKERNDPGHLDLLKQKIINLSKSILLKQIIIKKCVYMGRYPELVLLFFSTSYVSKIMA
jgi:hypothetical protein